LDNLGDAQHENGWKEVFRVIGLLSLGAVVVVAALFAGSYLSESGGGEWGEHNVVAAIDSNSANCTSDFPLHISLTNVANEDVLNVGFKIEVSDAGHSTVYFSDVIGSDRIIPAGHLLEDCFSIPPFRMNNNHPVPADGVPYTLASPQYSIVVSGTRLRGED